MRPDWQAGRAAGKVLAREFAEKFGKSSITVSIRQVEKAERQALSGLQSEIASAIRASCLLFRHDKKKLVLPVGAA